MVARKGRGSCGTMHLFLVDGFVLYYLQCVLAGTFFFRELCNILKNNSLFFFSPRPSLEIF